MPESLTETQKEFREKSVKFAKATRGIVDLNLDPREQYSRIQAQSKEAGFWPFNHPPDFGGKSQSFIDLVILHDTLGSENMCNVSGIFGPSPGVLANVDEPIRSKYLKPLLEGTKRAAFGFTEPDDASQATRGIIADGTLTINGQKSYVTGGHVADFINALVNIDDRGPAMVIIDREREGVDIKRIFTSSDGSKHAYMEFNEVKVPIEHIIGAPGEGLPRALDQITHTRMVLAAQSVGLARWVVDYTTNNINSPHRSGKPLATREGVRLRYSDMRINAYAARSMVYRTARLADVGENIVNEVIASKIFATETIGRIIDSGIQLVGGDAVRAGHPFEEINRHVRTWRLAEGASDVLRLNLARGILDLHKGRI